MTIPSNNPPPPGGYYNAPSPSKSSSNGCWKAAGISCLVLFVISIIVSAAIFISVKKAMKDPHSAFGQALSISGNVRNGMAIQRAIVKYHAAKRAYPDNLMQLVPQYIPDANSLHSTVDTNTDPTHVSWKYMKPSEGAPPNTPILVLNYTTIYPGQNTNRVSPPKQFVIYLDGTSISGSGYIGGSAK